MKPIPIHKKKSVAVLIITQTVRSHSSHVWKLHPHLLTTYSQSLAYLPSSVSGKSMSSSVKTLRGYEVISEKGPFPSVRFIWMYTRTAARVSLALKFCVNPFPSVSRIWNMQTWCCNTVESVVNGQPLLNQGSLFLSPKYTNRGQDGFKILTHMRRCLKNYTHKQNSRKMSCPLISPAKHVIQNRPSGPGTYPYVQSSTA